MQPANNAADLARAQEELAAIQAALASGERCPGLTLADADWRCEVRLIEQAMAIKVASQAQVATSGIADLDRDGMPVLREPAANGAVWLAQAGDQNTPCATRRYLDCGMAAQ